MGVIMAWFPKDREEYEFFEGLRDTPDRVAAILAASILEERLTDALKSRWHDVKMRGEQLLDKLFSYLGPLGSFGNKIDIGFAIGLYSESTLRDFHTIRRIRNKFAHKISPRDFEAQEIKHLTSNLSIPTKYPILASPSKPGFLRSGNNPTPFQTMEMFLGLSSVDDVTTSRNRFIRSVELIMGFLLVLLHDHPKVAPQF
jgi:hypothetical protein